MFKVKEIWEQYKAAQAPNAQTKSEEKIKSKRQKSPKCVVPSTQPNKLSNNEMDMNYGNDGRKKKAHMCVITTFINKHNENDCYQNKTNVSLFMHCLLCRCLSTFFVNYKQKSRENRILGIWHFIEQKSSRTTHTRNSCFCLSSFLTPTHSIQFALYVRALFSAARTGTLAHSNLCVCVYWRRNQMESTCV